MYLSFEQPLCGLCFGLKIDEGKTSTLRVPFANNRYVLGDTTVLLQNGFNLKRG